MLTAVSDQRTAETAMTSGAAAYWVKGHIDYDRLRTDVSKFVSPSQPA
jgi:response regulator of citrate/malate metabolism